MGFTNSYEDKLRAEAYAGLEFAGTYHLAYRDLPELIAVHLRGTKAVDFGCGTGRSTRFLRKLGLDAVGVDISEEMLQKAREIDPQGDYLLVRDGTLGGFRENNRDLIFAAFTFDNIPTKTRKIAIFRAMRDSLTENGRIVLIASAPEIYWHEWVSFSTRDFAAANRKAKCGERVRIIITDIDDKRPVEDIVWPDSDYRNVFQEAGLELLEMRKPLARGDEPYAWVNETRIAPWVIYVLRRGEQELRDSDPRPTAEREGPEDRSGLQ
jgi:SAM-dependent methyltransferase